MPLGYIEGNSIDPAVLNEESFKYHLIQLHREIQSMQEDNGRKDFLAILDNLVKKTLHLNERTEIHLSNGQ